MTFEAYLFVLVRCEDLVNSLLPQEIVFQLIRVLTAARGWRRIHPVQLLRPFLPRLLLLHPLQLLQLTLLLLLLTELV